MTWLLTTSTAHRLDRLVVSSACFKMFCISFALNFRVANSEILHEEKKPILYLCVTSCWRDVSEYSAA
ncbi:hypothetical protein A3742_16115 [Oleiphilus sp. HI0071]|nr:hypothetical protein A3737_09875 [Oleiphilus sp. HI0065]KZY87526.1 hypothetical protein A3742_16115 [Oleiphilus sp. HI0071]KZZ04691.1 hypothetical protein A3744_08350 [Oleiphilus sp. HI0073]KZZ10818.1 hypothetical protein A3750_07455 [Oleiphilus sp. HI0079]KZZ18483.1 hypothetical protein A3751_08025 [Oleiphilus sp. HI0080]KZZ40312.1 hypothetical protein A3758_24395 [Oleiphilus sp. HI0118]KZZ49498.1 hypothetical protein A3760_15060 [Oleiphilus sp. HI0122]KZZ74715.1 hypothetical protein A37